MLLASYEHAMDKRPPRPTSRHGERPSSRQEGRPGSSHSSQGGRPHLHELRTPPGRTTPVLLIAGYGISPTRKIRATNAPIHADFPGASFTSHFSPLAFPQEYNLSPLQFGSQPGSSWRPTSARRLNE